MTEPRNYWVGLPVGVTVHDNGNVTYEVDTSEAGSAIREIQFLGDPPGDADPKVWEDAVEAQMYRDADVVDRHETDELDVMTLGEAQVIHDFQEGMTVNVQWTVTFTAASRKIAAHIIQETEAKLIELAGTRHVPAIPTTNEEN